VCDTSIVKKFLQPFPVISNDRILYFRDQLDFSLVFFHLSCNPSRNWKRRVLGQHIMLILRQ
jgi:hypothetical protein